MKLTPLVRLIFSKHCYSFGLCYLLSQHIQETSTPGEGESALLAWCVHSKALSLIFPSPLFYVEHLLSYTPGLSTDTKLPFSLTVSRLYSGPPLFMKHENQNSKHVQALCGFAERSVNFTGESQDWTFVFRTAGLLSQAAGQLSWLFRSQLQSVASHSNIQAYAAWVLCSHCMYKRLLIDLLCILQSS